MFDLLSCCLPRYFHIDVYVVLQIWWQTWRTKLIWLQSEGLYKQYSMPSCVTNSSFKIHWALQFQVTLHGTHFVVISSLRGYARKYLADIWLPTICFRVACPSIGFRKLPQIWPPLLCLMAHSSHRPPFRRACCCVQPARRAGRLRKWCWLRPAAERTREREREVLICSGHWLLTVQKLLSHWGNYQEQQHPNLGFAGCVSEWVYCIQSMKLQSSQPMILDMIYQCSKGICSKNDYNDIHTFGIFWSPLTCFWKFPTQLVGGSNSAGVPVSARPLLWLFACFCLLALSHFQAGLSSKLAAKNGHCSQWWHGSGTGPADQKLRIVVLWLSVKSGTFATT